MLWNAIKNTVEWSFVETSAGVSIGTAYWTQRGMSEMAVHCLTSYKAASGSLPTAWTLDGVTVADGITNNHVNAGSNDHVQSAILCTGPSISDDARLDVDTNGSAGTQFGSTYAVHNAKSPSDQAAFCDGDGSTTGMTLAPGSVVFGCLTARETASSDGHLYTSVGSWLLGYGSVGQVNDVEHGALEILDGGSVTVGHDGSSSPDVAAMAFISFVPKWSPN